MFPGTKKNFKKCINDISMEEVPKETAADIAEEKAENNTDWKKLAENI